MKCKRLNNTRAPVTQTSVCSSAKSEVTNLMPRRCETSKRNVQPHRLNLTNKWSDTIRVSQKETPLCYFYILDECRKCLPKWHWELFKPTK